MELREIIKRAPAVLCPIPRFPDSTQLLRGDPGGPRPPRAAGGPEGSPPLVNKNVWTERFEDIRAFERYLARNGSAGDAKERGHWNAYMAAYEDTIRNTATKDAPWYAVPADNKVFTRLVVCAAVIETLARLDLAYPRVDKAKRAELAEARRMLGKG
jgi:Polyphosphate kinase 2 (PPK2)